MEGARAVTTIDVPLVVVGASVVILMSAALSTFKSKLDVLGQLRFLKPSTVLRVAEKQAHALSLLSIEAKRLMLPTFFAFVFATLVWPVFVAAVSSTVNLGIGGSGVGGSGIGSGIGVGSGVGSGGTSNRLSAFHLTWELAWQWYGLPSELRSVSRREPPKSARHGSRRQQQHRPVIYHGAENPSPYDLSQYESHDTMCANELTLSFEQCATTQHSRYTPDSKHTREPVRGGTNQNSYRSGASARDLDAADADACAGLGIPRRQQEQDPEETLRWNFSFDLDFSSSSSSSSRYAACSRARLAAEIKRIEALPIEERMGVAWAVLFEWVFPAADAVVLPIFLVSGGWWSVWSCITMAHGVFLNPFCFLSVAIMSVVTVFFAQVDAAYVSSLQSVARALREVRIRQTRRENMARARAGVALCGGCFGCGSNSNCTAVAPRDTARGGCLGYSNGGCTAISQRDTARSGCTLARREPGSPERALFQREICVVSNSCTHRCSECRRSERSRQVEATLCNSASCTQIHLGVALPDDITDIVFDYLNGDSRSEAPRLPMFCVDERALGVKEQSAARRRYLTCLLEQQQQQQQQQRVGR